MDRLGTSVRPFALLAAEQVPDVDDSETNPCLGPYQQGLERSDCPQDHARLPSLPILQRARELGDDDSGTESWMSVRA